MTATVKVLNGEVKAGDTIAYSTRSGSSQDMTIGEVVGFGEAEGWGGPHPTLKVQPSSTSGYHTSPYKIVTLTVLDRVVKLGAEASPTLAEFTVWLDSFGTVFETAFEQAAEAAKEDDDMTDVAVAMAGGLAMIKTVRDRINELTAVPAATEAA